MRRPSFVVPAVALLVFTAGCKSDGTVDPDVLNVRSVTIDPGPEIAVGETSLWIAVALDENGSPVPNAEITWTSANTTIASIVSVQAGGGQSRAEVRANASGNTTITARSGGSDASAPIFVARGFLTGRVVDARSEDAIAGATVRFTTGPNDVGGTPSTTDGGGVYTSRALSTPSVNIDVSKAGYLPVTYFAAEVFEGQRTTIETIPLVPEGFGSGTIGGRVKNARNNAPIEGAVVLLKPGMNSVAQTVAQTTTAADGFYSLGPVTGGTYTVRVEKPAFAPGVRTGIVVGASGLVNQDVVLSPSGTDIRIVLTWSVEPEDLDAHLTGPIAGGGRFHVYFSDEGNLTASPFAALDVDDVTAFGPETMTIVQMVAGGAYRFSVHDFTNRTSTSSRGLALSSARVQVFASNNTKIGDFNVPNQAGTLWTVFELTGTLQAPVVRAINTMGFQASPGAVTKPTSAEWRR